MSAARLAAPAFHPAPSHIDATRAYLAAINADPELRRAYHRCLCVGGHLAARKFLALVEKRPAVALLREAHLAGESAAAATAQGRVVEPEQVALRAARRRAFDAYWAHDAARVQLSQVARALSESRASGLWAPVLCSLVDDLDEHCGHEAFAPDLRASFTDLAGAIRRLMDGEVGVTPERLVDLETVAGVLRRQVVARADELRAAVTRAREEGGGS